MSFNAILDGCVRNDEVDKAHSHMGPELQQFNEQEQTIEGDKLLLTMMPMPVLLLVTVILMLVMMMMMMMMTMMMMMMMRMMNDGD